MRSVPPAKKRRATFSDQVKLFIEALIANPNVTRAYSRAYPNATPASACASGHRLLRNALVKRAVELGRKARLERYGMEADHAMNLIALIARVDPRRLYDDHGRILPVSDWPDDIAFAVASFQQDQSILKVTFASRLRALQLVVGRDRLSQAAEAPTSLRALLTPRKEDNGPRRTPS